MQYKIIAIALSMLLLVVSSPLYGAKPQDPVTPFAEAHADVTTGPAPLFVQFTARGSFDPDNGPLTYSWDFGDGSTATGLDVPHAYEEGFYVAVLTVTDDQGLFDVTSIEIRAATDSVPTITASASPSSGTAPLTVDFNVSVFGGDGTLTYHWEFGDGAASSFPNPSHTYSNPGTFTATVTVTDENGDSDIASIAIDVISP